MTTDPKPAAPVDVSPEAVEVYADLPLSGGYWKIPALLPALTAAEQRAEKAEAECAVLHAICDERNAIIETRTALLRKAEDERDTLAARVEELESRVVVLSVMGPKP